MKTNFSWANELCAKMSSFLIFLENIKPIVFFSPQALIISKVQFIWNENKILSVVFLKPNAPQSLIFMSTVKTFCFRKYFPRTENGLSVKTNISEDEYLRSVFKISLIIDFQKNRLNSRHCLFFSKAKS